MPSETIANGTNKIIHRLDLNDYGLAEVPGSVRDVVKQEVASYLENEILRSINSSTSPVEGEGRFSALKPEYAVRVKGGRRLSDLENEGDLLNDFKVKSSRGSFLTVGHEGDSDEVAKADGHNQLSGKAKAWASKIKYPKRRYIPDDNQTFTDDIENGIRNIIDEFKVESTIDRPLELDNIKSAPRQVDIIEPETTVEIDSLFDDDIIEELLGDAINRRI